MQTVERDLVVLFTDISGYTGFVSSKGSTAAMGLLHQHNAIVKPVIEQFGGVFVKSTGDGVIAYFEQARPAVEAAVIIQQRLAAYNMGRREDEEIHIRGGLHCGPAVVEPGEIIGHSVNFAARLVAVCKRDQIVISKQLYKKVKALRHLSFKRIGYAALQGIPEPQEVYEVCWDIIRLEEKEKAATIPHQGSWLTQRRVISGLVLLTLAVILVVLWPVLSGIWRDTSRELSTTSAEASAMYELGREYALKGDDEQALAALNQAISVDANFAEAYLEAAFIYHDIEEEKKAKEYARRADELGASVGEPFRLKTQGLLYELDGDLDRALQTYQLLVRRYPRDADAHLYLASVAMWMGRHDEARVSLLACLTIDPTNPYCHYNLMMLQIRRNEFDEVIAAYESLRRKGVEYPWFDEPVGVAYWGKEDSNKAAAHFQRLTTARVGGFKVHGSVHFRTAKEWLAGMAIYQGKLKESRRLIDQLATEAASSDVPATYLLELAKTQAFVGNRALAIEYAKTAVSTTNDPCIRLDAGLLATGLEEHPTRSQPSAPPRECPETYLSRGTLALAQEETDTAIQQLSMSAERDENLEARYLLAHAYMHERRWQDAITQLNIVASSKGTILLDYPASVWPLSHYDLAVCYEGLGKYEQALLHYSEFLKTWDGADAGLQPLVRAKERLAVVSGKR